MIDRRVLLQRTIGAALGMALGAVETAAGEERQVVLVRQLDGRLVMVTENDVLPVRKPLPATPATVSPSLATPIALPETLDASVTEGTVGYWMGTPDGSAHVFRLDTGAAPTWWWLSDGARPLRLPLPGALEPAFPSGTVVRWFHGAVVDAAHLGAGTLRLTAVEIATGEIALDRELDRRLELAATAVTAGGEAVAHAQATTSGVDFWAADLRDDTVYEAGAHEDAAPVAASALDLLMAVEGEGIVVATGLTWSSPGHPPPRVVVLRSGHRGAIGFSTVYGDLIAIVPESSVAVDPEG